MSCMPHLLIPNNATKEIYPPTQEYTSSSEDSQGIVFPFGVDWLQNRFYICVTEFVSVKFSKVTRICIHINKRNDYKLVVFVAFTALTVLYSTGPTVKTVWLKQREYLHEMQLSRSLTIWLR